jgi:magnesium and cobalt exporter, CNNM family
VLTLVNGILAGAEIAVVAVRKSRLEQLVDEGGRRARAIAALRAVPERFFATVQIGITVIGATAGAFGGRRLAGDLEPSLRTLPLLGGYSDGLSLVLVVSIISYLSLVLGELVPKSLALRGAERYALLVGPPLLALAKLVTPLVWLLTASSNVVLRIFGDRTTFTESRLSPEELQQMVEEATAAGSLHPKAGEIVSRAFDFADLTAAAIMIPRSRVTSIPRKASIDEVRQLVLEKGHMRMPVHEGTIDNVVGYVSIKDLIALAWEGKLIVIEDLMRPAYFVPENVPAVDVLDEMRARRVQLAIVVDEGGGMAGVLTLEDLLEELVGEIRSERDEAPPEMIRREADGSFLVRGDAPIRDLNRELAIDLPESPHWSTIAGLCLELAERVPAIGDRLTSTGGVVLEIVDASPRTIRTVRLRIEKPEPA